jgi:large subunit ribosomal protein L20
MNKETRDFGSAERLPKMASAHRARQRYTGACRPISSDLGWGKAVHTRDKPVVLRERVAREHAPFVSAIQLGEKPMARVKRGTKRRARRKKYLKRTKGFFLTKSKLYQSAQEAANRADRYAKRDRRVKKRQYRRLWIQRIGAAARLNGTTYGQLIHGLKAAGVELDRKVLADIAVKDAAGFTALAEKAKTAAKKK